MGSALIDCLQKYLIPETTVKIRLFVDGCARQNKNAHVIYALYWWLLQKSHEHLREILLVLPVRGQSYLPADRVFAELRRRSTILLPSEYNEIYKQYGEVTTLGTDWEIKDVKGLYDSLKKI